MLLEPNKLNVILNKIDCMYQLVKALTITKSQKTGNIVLGILGAVVAAYGIYIAVMVAKKPPKMSFEELLAKKGLEFRNKILVNKSTGKNSQENLKEALMNMGKTPV